MATMVRKQESREDRDSPVLFVRGVSSGLKRKLRAAAALAGYRGLPAYVIQVLETHVSELERKGVLPKGK